MKNLKFRAYNIDDGIMLYPNSNTGGDYIWEIWGDDAKIVILTYQEYHTVEGGEHVTRQDWQPIKMELMQFIGLQDKNNKDIYEGDILKIQLPLGGFWGNVKKEKIGVVKYEPDFGGFIVMWEYSKNQHHERMGCDLDCEIIGNIYENEEILG